MNAAKTRGLPTVVLRPDLSGTRCKGEVARRYHERNGRVVDASDRLIALVSHDRTGGTENTIAWARRAGKPVEIVHPDGRTERLA